MAECKCPHCGNRTIFMRITREKFQAHCDSFVGGCESAGPLAETAEAAYAAFYSPAHLLDEKCLIKTTTAQELFTIIREDYALHDAISDGIFWANSKVFDIGSELTSAINESKGVE